jgi:hypothetical protein
MSEDRLRCVNWKFYSFERYFNKARKKNLFLGGKMGRTHLLVGTILCVFLLWTSTAFAMQPLVTDDADTEGRGGILLEVGNELSFDRQTVDSEKVRTRDNETVVALSYGFLDNLDLILEMPYLFTRARMAGESETENGIGDLVLEVKWRFYEGNPGALALKPSLSLPTGEEARGLGTGKLSFGLTLIASIEFEPIDLHLNLGYAHNRFKLTEDRFENRRHIWSASLAAVRELAPRLDLVGDIGIESHESRHSNLHPAFALLGVVYELMDNVDLDFGVKFGLSRPEADVAVLAGLTWSL